MTIFNVFSQFYSAWLIESFVIEKAGVYLAFIHVISLAFSWKMFSIIFFKKLSIEIPSLFIFL